MGGPTTLSNSQLALNLRGGRGKKKTWNANETYQKTTGKLAAMSRGKGDSLWCSGERGGGEREGEGRRLLLPEEHLSAVRTVTASPPATPAASATTTATAVVSSPPVAAAAVIAK